MLDSLIAQFETVQWPGPCPWEAPSGWILFNAFRPLFGTLKSGSAGGSYRWFDCRGPSGQHWAAVAPTDPQAAMWLEHNLRMRAVIVERSEPIT